MDSTQELGVALREMDLRGEDIALEYDSANGCLVLVRRDENYQDLEHNQGEVLAAFYNDGGDNPLASWLIDQIREANTFDRVLSPR